MIILPDEQEYDVSVIWHKKRISMTTTIYDGMQIGDPIYYDDTEKIFTPVHNGANQALVGYFLHYNKSTHIVTVMYRDFLVNNVLEIPGTIKQTYIQSFLKKSFESYRNMIIKNMPRIKRLKRMKLQMMNKTALTLLHDNIDNIIQTYTDVFNEEKAKELKARIVTTPLYMKDNNTVKVYDFAMNELKMPDIETEGNFLSFFLYQDQRTIND